MKEKTTISTPVRIDPAPLGRNPPCAVRLANPAPGLSEPGSTPKTASTPMRTKAAMATTLIPANQNSNSP